MKDERSAKPHDPRRTLLLLLVAWSLALAPMSGRTLGIGVDSLVRPDPAMSWIASMVSDTEPGERIVVSGTVYAADGVSPLAGVLLYFYQTDAKGRYSIIKGDRTPRLRAWLRTNGEGKYELRTVKPAPYPGRTLPAHIHVQATPPEKPGQWVDEFLFEGDPFIKESEAATYAGLGRFSPMLKITAHPGAAGRSRHDIRLK